MTTGRINQVASEFLATTGRVGDAPRPANGGRTLRLDCLSLPPGCCSDDSRFHRSLLSAGVLRVPLPPGCFRNGNGRRWRHSQGSFLSLSFARFALWCKQHLTRTFSTGQVKGAETIHRRRDDQEFTRRTEDKAG